MIDFKTPAVSAVLVRLVYEHPEKEFRVVRKGKSRMAEKNIDDSKGLFEETDRVLVPEGDLFYEAKILGREKEDGKFKYLVHYQGWNKKWDEWLTAGDLVRDTAEARVEEREKLDAAVQSMKKGGVRHVKGEAKAPKPASHKSKKLKTEEKNDEKISAKVQMNIELPSSLKKQLVSDWEHITRDNLLVPLPRTPTVKVLLQQYLEEVGGEHKKDTIQEVVQGIQAYFDKALANILLYKEERDQCDELLQNSVAPSDVYGAEHLLRLFIKLPELLPYKSMEEATVRGLEKRIAEVTTWLQRNEANLFVPEYMPAEKGKKSEPAE